MKVCLNTGRYEQISKYIKDNGSQISYYEIRVLYLIVYVYAYLYLYMSVYIYI